MSNRLRFFLTHLLLSCFVASVALSLIFCGWYPAPLAKAVGVTHLVVMMLLIDVIIGPILGFLVYKQGKKSLKFDLCTIVFIQILAFCYGIYSIFDGRPVWLVYSIDRIEVIQANNVNIQPKEKIRAEYKTPSLLKPQYVSTQLSENKEQRQSDMFNAVFGLTLAQQPNRYMPLSSAKKDILKYSQNLEILNKYNGVQDVKNILQTYPQADSWVPLKAKVVDMVVLMNKEKGEVIQIVDLRPWKD